MKQQQFSLQPFPETHTIPNLHITGNIIRENNLLNINYQLTGNLPAIRISPPANKPTRQDELWQGTCFEFFLGIKNSPRYWEFNLSPSGDWNVYRFDNYRQGMAEETTFKVLPFDVENQLDSLILSCNLDLDKIVSSGKTLEVGITTVIKQIDGNISYWALIHKGKEADFHVRDSFIVEL